MESLSRPPHRRKHSTTTNASSSSSSFSLKNPYDDVLLSKGGKAKFEAHEYAEIFSGSSSIPVLDLSGLNEQVGSGDCRSSKLDYSNIFGGLRDDDVAVPYEQLFNGALKKNKTRIPADAESPFQEPGSLNSSGKTKRSSGTSDQSIDGTKQHFNMSFNKTSQRNSDESNGKTHIAQLHAVPGFTHFVDETPHLQKKERDRPVPLMKREVSRTWSFNSGVEGITVKGGLSSEKSHIPDKSCNGNEINIKSHISKVPPPSSHPSNPNDNKDLRQSRLPSFASKDASKKTVGEYSPPLFDEELDENSVAAVSAAALKKAIEQAQESIRIAKMIMEKKKEGLKDGSRPRSNGRLKVKDKKETRIDHVPDDSKENNVRETYERLDPTFPMFTGVDGKFIPPLSHSDNFLNAGKTKVEMVRENVEAADEHGDAFTEVGKKFAPSCSRSEILNPDEKVEVESVRQNVEAAETCGETTTFTGLVANSTCGSVTLESGKGGNNDNIICSTNKVAPRLEQIETVKETLEQRELTIHQSKGPEVISERAESAPNTSQSVQELEKSVDEALEQCQATVDHIKGPENIAEQLERVLNCSESTQEQEKIMHERGGNLRISQEDEPIEESDNVADDKEKYEKRFVRHEELVCLEHLTVLKSEFNNLQNESRSLAEKDVMEQADMDKKSENVSEWKENDQDGKSSDEEESGMVLKKKHLWFESELQPMEPMEEEISEGEPEIFPEVEVGTKVNVAYEPEIVDKKLNFEHEEDGQKLPREYGQNEIAYRHMDSFECEAAETIQLETNNYSEVQKSGVPWGVEEINDTLRGSGRSKENQDKFEFQEAASGKDIDEAVDAHCNNSGTIFSDSHSNSTSTIFSETQEPCDVDLNNKAEEYQAAVSGVARDVEEINDTHRGAGRSEENQDKFQFQEAVSGKDIDEAVDAHCNDSGTIFSDSHSNNTSTICSETQEPCDIDLNNKAEEYQAAVRGCKQNDSLPLETETFSAVEDEVGKPFHLEVNKMPGTDSLRRCASEEKFIESQPSNTFEEFSFDRKTYNVDLIDADNEETLSTDEDTFKTASEIHNAAQEYAAKINMKNLPEFHATNNNATEFDNTNVKPVLEQTSESNEESPLTSILENIDEVSAHESQACRENVKDNASNKEEVKDDLDMTSDEREYVGGEQSECLYSKDQSREVSSQTNCEPKEMDKSMEAEREVETGQNMEMKEENLSRTSTMGQKDAKGNEQKFATNDHQQRIEAIKRGREREKDRIVVERAIREARERAFAEARDRAERAAVERAAAEARQRVMAEVREKHEKASIETKQPAADKASNEAKLRAERAAVERATAEARERALEKAMSQKTFIEARTQAEKYSTDRFSSSSRKNGLKHSFSSSDLEKFDGATSESAQRRKARLERHQRIMERAAKALAEKNMRDLLAQKEQAERNRLAESLDADIKRWATGKEGNLRALLSTLQYILGPDSGWQPISLTEIITTAAVKKAYRKATLCVHPDKLQQRGASIQQKYICEKVFDLLKAAWNRFNSEER